MATYIVTNLGDSSPGSLRAAIKAANAAGSPSDIKFAVAGVITRHAALPSVRADVTIDGTTAPGHTENGPPVVAIDFNHHASLTFAKGSAGSQLLGLSLGGASGDGVTLNSGSITI